MTQQNKTPNCNTHELLVTYLYGETVPEESLRFESHLIDCASCRQELSAFEGVRESLQQWQFDEAPNVQMIAETAVQTRKSALALLKELFTIMPLWTKGLGAFAAAMLVLAVLGTDVSIGKGGFSFHTDVLRTNKTQVVPTETALDSAQVEQIRAEMLAKVDAMISESQRLQKEELQAQLVNFQSQLKDIRSADLVKIATRIQLHNVKIQTLERDIDRREGLGLTDILFGDATPPAKEPSGSKTSGD